VKSVPETAKSEEKYAEVIRESYTPLDEALYSGEPPEFGKNILVGLGETYSITLAGIAFLVVSAVVRHRRKTMIGVNDAAVLAYTTPGGAAVPLITRPMRARVAILATRFVIDSTLYLDPDAQSVIYETNGVPPGPMRKHVHKGEGTFIYRTPETINVEWASYPSDILF